MVNFAPCRITGKLGLPLCLSKGDHPNHWTQGKTVEELEEMLVDLYELEQQEEPKAIPERKIGKLVLRSA